MLHGLTDRKGHKKTKTTYKDVGIKQLSGHQDSLNVRHTRDENLDHPFIRSKKCFLRLLVMLLVSLLL